MAQFQIKSGNKLPLEEKLVLANGRPRWVPLREITAGTLLKLRRHGITC
jgi:hypothetical protein